MNSSSIRKVVVLGLYAMGTSFVAPAAWAQQGAKEPVQVTGAELQAWLSRGFVIAGEDHTNGSVFMNFGEASQRQVFYRTQDGVTGTSIGTQRVVGDMFCTKWSFMGLEVCREWYRVGESKYEGRNKGSTTKATTLYIVK